MGIYKKLKISFKKSYLYIIIAILLAFIFTASLVFYKNKSNKDNVFKRDINLSREFLSERYYYENQYEKALVIYRELFEESHEEIWLLRQADIYSILEDYEKSRELIKEAELKLYEKQNDGINAKLMEKQCEALNYMIFLELMNKDYQKALEDGEKYITIYKNYKPLIKMVFALHLINKDIESAKVMVSGYEVDYKSSYDLAEYAYLHMILEDWDKGLTLLREAWELDKEEFKVWDVVAQMASDNGNDFIEKVSYLMESNPRDNVYKLWLAKIYSMREETSEMALTLLKDLREDFDGSLQFNLIKAYAMQNVGNEKESDGIINTIISAQGEDYRISHTSAWYFYNKNQYDEALYYANKSMEQNKNYTDNYAFLIPEIYKSQGKGRKAEPFFRRAIYEEPYNYNIFMNMGSYYWNTENNAVKALEYYGLAEDLMPNHGEIKYKMAFINISKKRYDEALKILKQCISLDNTVSKYHRSIGTIYMTQGNHSEGIKEIRIAYEADKKDILNLNNAGIYYITIEENFDRGLYNLKAAYEKINNKTEKYVADTIKENYKNAKELYEKYLSSPSEELLTVPDFVLFY